LAIDDDVCTVLVMRLLWPLLLLAAGCAPRLTLAASFDGCHVNGRLTNQSSRPVDITTCPYNNQVWLVLDGEPRTCPQTSFPNVCVDQYTRKRLDPGESAEFACSLELQPGSHSVSVGLKSVGRRRSDWSGIVNSPEVQVHVEMPPDCPKSKPYRRSSPSNR
jgi:hypothetical protein